MPVLKSLSLVRNHNREIQKGGIGKESLTDIRDTVQADIPKFAVKLQKIRKGLMEVKLAKGGSVTLPPVDMSFEKAIEQQYGIKGIPAFLDTAFGFSAKSGTAKELSKVLGHDNLTVRNMEDFMVASSEQMNFANPMSTQEIDSTFRFILPEVFFAAIRTGYEHGVMHNDWIATTINMTQETLVMPQILRGDGMPSRVNEGADIPMGSLAFGKKTVDIFKIGTGFKMTDELISRSNLNMLSIFLGEVGNDMGIGADSLAFMILINGEQADLSESAPIVGVINTSTGFQYKDLKKVFTRMNRLRQPADRIISGEDDGVDITGIQQFEGFQGETRLASIRSIVGVPEKFDMDTYVLPANKVMFLNKAKAMAKLMQRGMLTERRRNPKNQTEELFISDFINFAILKRDARVIQDKSLDIATNGFPSYMDIDSRINAAFAAL